MLINDKDLSIKKIYRKCEFNEKIFIRFATIRILKKCKLYIPQVIIPSFGIIFNLDILETELIGNDCSKIIKRITIAMINF